MNSLVDGGAFRRKSQLRLLAYAAAGERAANVNTTFAASSYPMRSGICYCAVESRMKETPIRFLGWPDIDARTIRTTTTRGSVSGEKAIKEPDSRIGTTRTFFSSLACTDFTLDLIILWIEGVLDLGGVSCLKSSAGEDLIDRHQFKPNHTLLVWDRHLRMYRSSLPITQSIL